MQTIRPENLTTRELVQQAWLIGPDQMPKEWVEALLKKLEKLVDVAEGQSMLSNSARHTLNALDSR